MQQVIKIESCERRQGDRNILDIRKDFKILMCPQEEGLLQLGSSEVNAG